MSAQTPENTIESERSPATFDLDALIRELDEGFERLPEGALRECQANAERVTPRLIEALEKATRLRRGGKSPPGSAHLYGLYLLAEFRATQALPALLEMLTLPEDALDDLVGDDLTESIPRILGTLGAEHPDLIESMIAKHELFYFVRSAAAGALCAMVAQGTLPRSAAVEGLMRQMRSAVEAGDRDTATIAVCHLGNLNPLEVQDEIRSAFERKLINEEMTSWHGFAQYDLYPDRPGECPHLNREHFVAIDDAVAELNAWRRFDEMPERQVVEELSSGLRQNEWSQSYFGDGLDEDALDGELGDLAPPHYDQSLTIRNEAHRIGRNDPCPCGSGKKYKKCCLKRGDE